MRIPVAILLELGADLFDAVPLDQMTDAEHAVREAAANTLGEMRARFETAADLTDEDRNTIIDIARQSIAGFRPKSEPEFRPEAQTRAKPAPKEKS
jgi:F-type H+-transporting ATPase subunit alpha